MRTLTLSIFSIDSMILTRLELILRARISKKPDFSKMTLTETAYWARRIIKYGSITLVSLIVAIFAWRGIYFVYRLAFPKPPPPPEVKFKTLPPLVYDSRVQPALTYKLETEKGEDLSTLPTQANVYFMPTPQSSLSSLDAAVQVAQALGYSPAGTPLSDVIYRFSHRDTPSVLDINIVNKTASISYNLVEDPSLLALRPRSEAEAINVALSFLTRGGLLAQDLAQGRQEVEKMASGPEALVRVGSISEANFVRVNFLRRNYDGLPVIASKIDRGNVWLLVSGETSGPKQVIAGEYHYFPVAEEQRSTYPIKTAQVAWEELQAGKGFIISPPSSGTSVTIRRVSLAYYDSGKPQQFLQPVVVFDGDGGFRAVVPAVVAEYYQSQ